MIAGHVTFDELLIITGLPKPQLKDLLNDGIRNYYISCNMKDRSLPYLYNLKEVEHWLKLNINVVR